MKNKPHLVKLKKDKNYAWCECSESKNQPFCDGSHSKVKQKFDTVVDVLVKKNLISNAVELQRLIEQIDKNPVLFKAEKDIEVSLCGCKKSDNAPFCSGEHVNI